jgi:cyclic beta-1,2-glucan synthetase
VNLLLIRAPKAPAFAEGADELIRSELFRTERLEQHAGSLDAAQPVTTKPTARRRLARRLGDNGRLLLDAYRTIGERQV